MRYVLICALVFGCTTVPDGYKRMDDTEVCYSSALSSSSVGEGSLIPGLSRMLQTTFSYSDVEVTILHMRSQEDKTPLSGYVADPALGLFKRERGGSLSYTDNPDSPSFIYNCQDGKCVRFASFAGHDLLSSPPLGIAGWRSHEKDLSVLFAHIVRCP